MAGNARHVINMANSIVGVSILSMPFCFKETGLVLGVLLVLLSGHITKKTCMFLIRSAIMARRRSYEFLAFHVFGVSGKLFVELCMILFLVGICISFHVVMGDLAPAIVARLMNVDNSPSLRCTLLIGVALLVVLPLCLLRNLDSLASMSACSIGFYFFLITVVFWYAFPKLMDGSWYHVAELWRPSGALQVLPIYVLGLSCQSNVFEIYDSIPDPDVPKMRSVVNHALNLCCALYISVGFLGYVAFTDQDLSGNLIMSFPNSHLTEGIKMFFTVSLAISFPLVIFPCRTSIHSLLYRRSNPSSFDLVGNYMPESRFKGITIGILTVSLVVGILIPNIEFVLGLLGSTMGVLIALILPSLLFIKVNSKASVERLVAQGIMLMGVVLIVTGTYLNVAHINEVQAEQQAVAVPELVKNNVDPILPKIEEKVADEVKAVEAGPVGGDSATRREPVAPEPPPEESEKDEEKITNLLVKAKEKLDMKETKDEIGNAHKSKMETGKKVDVRQSSKDIKEDKIEGDTLHPDAIQKEEKVNKEEGNGKKNEEEVDKKQAELLEKIEVQHKEQQKILAEQKQILKELKDQKAKQEQELKRQEEENRIAAAVKPAVANIGRNPGVANPDFVPVAAVNPGLDPAAVNLGAVKSPGNAADVNLPPVKPAVDSPRVSSNAAVNHAAVKSGDLVPGVMSDTSQALLGAAVASQNEVVAPLAPLTNEALAPHVRIPVQSHNYQAKGSHDTIPNYPISGNQMVYQAAQVPQVVSVDSMGNQPGPQSQADINIPVPLANDIRQVPVAGHGSVDEVGKPKVELAPDAAFSEHASQKKVHVPIDQLQQNVQAPVGQSQMKVQAPAEEKHVQKKLQMSQAVDTHQEKDAKKSHVPYSDKKQVDVGGQNEGSYIGLPRTKGSEDVSSADGKQKILTQGKETSKSQVENSNGFKKVTDKEKKAKHDEERRKREAKYMYSIDFPEVKLLKDIKPRDAGEVAYDTRHLLWTSRSRRKRRRNDRGRDDYYWDET